MDATQISDESVKHKESKFKEMTSQSQEVERKGQKFLSDAKQAKCDPHLDLPRAVMVVESILSQMTERKYTCTEYYEHWKVHVSSGREFKSQWHQFVQDARKVRVGF